MNNHEFYRPTGFPWYRIGLWGALLIIGYFLFTEHRAHVIPFLPFLFLLACPFMHMFMHKGHGDHGSSSHETRDPAVPVGHRHEEETKREPK